MFLHIYFLLVIPGSGFVPLHTDPSRLLKYKYRSPNPDPRIRNSDHNNSYKNKRHVVV